MTTRLQEWWDGGHHVDLELNGTSRSIFVRESGSGPSMTLIHGFPSSSHDWAKVEPVLAERHHLLMPDLLGFGASDRPLDHEYSIHEQADLVEALWRHEGIGQTILVAHDYGVSVAQELLARRAEGALAVDITALHFLNGGLWPDLHRPEPVQLALLDSEQGPAISAMMTAELSAGALAPTFAPGYDAADDSADIWEAGSHGDVILHRLIRYMNDRKQHQERWVTALETTDAPLNFIWGMLDPISGAHVAERIRERLPDAPLTTLEDVAHWPPLEAPERVAGAILSMP
jgi:pimeloyl-ACP methyl ester carboxylesterase